MQKSKTTRRILHGEDQESELTAPMDNQNWQSWHSKEVPRPRASSPAGLTVAIPTTWPGMDKADLTSLDVQNDIETALVTPWGSPSESQVDQPGN